MLNLCHVHALSMSPSWSSLYHTVKTRFVLYSKESECLNNNQNLQECPLLWHWHALRHDSRSISNHQHHVHDTTASQSSQLVNKNPSTERRAFYILSKHIEGHKPSVWMCCRLLIKQGKQLSCTVILKLTMFIFHIHRKSEPQTNHMQVSIEQCNLPSHTNQSRTSTSINPFLVNFNRPTCRTQEIVNLPTSQPLGRILRI